MFKACIHLHTTQTLSFLRCSPRWVERWAAALPAQVVPDLFDACTGWGHPGNHLGQPSQNADALGH
jgi:hypothetical protein